MEGKNEERCETGETKKSYQNGWGRDEVGVGDKEVTHGRSEGKTEGTRKHSGTVRDRQRDAESETDREIQRERQRDTERQREKRKKKRKMRTIIRASGHTAKRGKKSLSRTGGHFE